MRIWLWPYTLIIAAGITMIVTLTRLDSGIAYSIEPVVIENIQFDIEADAESSPSDLVMPYFAPMERIAKKLPETQSFGSETMSVVEVQPSLVADCNCRVA